MIRILADIRGGRDLNGEDGAIFGGSGGSDRKKAYKDILVGQTGVGDLAVLCKVRKDEDLGAHAALFLEDGLRTKDRGGEVAVFVRGAPSVELVEQGIFVEGEFGLLVALGLRDGGTAQQGEAIFATSVASNPSLHGGTSAIKKGWRVGGFAVAHAHGVIEDKNISGGLGRRRALGALKEGFGEGKGESSDQQAAQEQE